MPPEETTQTQPETTESRKGSSLRKVVVAIIIIAVLAGAAYFVYSMGYIGGTVAVVNGEKITKSEYNKRYAQAAALFMSQGLDTEKDDVKALVKQQVIDDLVAEELVLQAAEKEGMTVNNETVDAQMTQAKGQYSDDAAFQAELDKQGFTESSFKSALQRQNIIQQYLTKNVDVSGITASNTEIQNLYDQVKASNENIQSLSEIREQVEAEVIRQKQQALVTSFIQQLRSQGQVEILLK